MTAVNTVTDLTREGDIAVITINSPPVNALSADVRNGLRDGVSQAAADPAVKAIVVICAGRTFIAGADISRIWQAVDGSDATRTANPAGRRAEARHRRRARHRAWRRLRNGADVSLSRGGAIGEIRPARDQAWTHSGRRRNATPAAPLRHRECARRDPFGKSVSRQAGAGLGCRRRTGGRRKIARRRDGLCPQGHRHPHAAAQNPRPQRQDRGRARQAGNFRQGAARQCPQISRLRGLAIGHPRGSGGGRPALRRRHEARAAIVSRSHPDARNRARNATSFSPNGRSGKSPTFRKTPRSCRSRKSA